MIKPITAKPEAKHDDRHRRVRRSDHEDDRGALQGGPEQACREDGAGCRVRAPHQDDAQHQQGQVQQHDDGEDRLIRAQVGDPGHRDRVEGSGHERNDRGEEAGGEALPDRLRQVGADLRDPPHEAASRRSVHGGVRPECREGRVPGTLRAPR